MNTATTTPESLRIPLRAKPAFVSKLGRAASEIGFADAVIDVFGNAGISFELESDLTASDEHGLIIASDHRHRIEPLVVQAAMSHANRDASHVIAMPTSFAGRLMQSTGEHGSKLVIPVIPGASSADNKLSFRKRPRDAMRQRLYPNVLALPKAETRKINAQAIDTAAQLASTGDTVSIFTTGESDHPWRRGLGQIISGVAPEARDTTDVAILRPDSFSVKKVMSALALRDLGIHPRKQTIVMRAARLGTVNDLFASHLATDGQEVAQHITDMIHESYKAKFRGIESENSDAIYPVHDAMPALAGTKTY